MSQDGDWITGSFESPDVEVYCDFVYNTVTKEYEIRNHNLPIKEILPLPFFWIDSKLQKNGVLRQKEFKISY